MDFASFHYFTTKSDQTFSALGEKRTVLLYWNFYILIPTFHAVFLTCCFVVPRTTIRLLLRGHVQSLILITVVSLLFKLEDKRGLHEEFKPQWSARKLLNWQHCNSYIMPQPNDLFCHTILLAKLIMPTSFNLLANNEGVHTPVCFWV